MDKLSLAALSGDAKRPTLSRMHVPEDVLAETSARVFQEIADVEVYTEVRWRTEIPPLDRF